MESDLKEDLGARVNQATTVAQDKVQEAGEVVKDAVRRQVDTRSTQVGEQAATVSRVLYRAGQDLRSQGQRAPGELLEQAAGRVDAMGRYLTEADSQRFLSDLEDFGRRQPLAMFAIGVAAGLVAARFLNGSRRRGA